MSNNSNPNPYRQQDERRRSPDLDDLASSVVNFGVGVGSTVLSSIADALNAVGDSLNGNAPAADNGFVRYRRRLDSRLSNHYGGWMTMGVLGWICFGCFAVAALVMAILLGVAPGDPALQQALDDGDHQIRPADLRRVNSRHCGAQIAEPQVHQQQQRTGQTGGPKSSRSAPRPEPVSGCR